MPVKPQYIIPRAIAREVLNDAISASYQVNVDQLDCAVSCARQPTDKTVKEVLEIGLSPDTKTLFNFIYRDQSFLPQEYKDKDGLNPNRDYFDVGFSTITEKPNYFLWIRLEVKEGYRLIEKYKLERKY